MRASHPDRLSSVITYTNLFVYLITGETSYHNSTALLTGLAVISCCSSVPVSMPKDFVRSFRTLVDWYFRILGEVFSNLSFLKFPSDLVFFFLNLAATYSPTPSPVQYHRPFRSLPSCSGWERVLPLNASPPKAIGLSEVFSSLVLSLFSLLGSFEPSKENIPLLDNPTIDNSKIPLLLSSVLVGLFQMKGNISSVLVGLFQTKESISSLERR